MYCRNDCGFIHDERDRPDLGRRFCLRQCFRYAWSGERGSQCQPEHADSRRVNQCEWRANAKASQSKENKGTEKSSAAAGSNSAAGVNGASGALSSGTTLQAELTKPIDAKKAKPGDEVTAKLTQDVKGSGQVVMHKGTKLVGHVTEAQAKSKENAESKLGIAFDKAVLKGGQEMAFTGVIQALAARCRALFLPPADELAVWDREWAVAAAVPWAVVAAAVALLPWVAEAPQ